MGRATQGGSRLATNGSTNQIHSMAAAPTIYSDQMWLVRRKKFNMPQHTATESSIALSSNANSHWDTGAMSSFFSAKKEGSSAARSASG